MRRQRRESEFTDFYAARRLSLRRTAYLIVRDWHTAEDLTQQSMVKLYAAWPRVRSETVDASARRPGRPGPGPGRGWARAVGPRRGRGPRPAAAPAARGRRAALPRRPVGRGRGQ